MPRTRDRGASKRRTCHGCGAIGDAPAPLVERVVNDIRYEGYVLRQHAQVRRQSEYDSVSIPESFDPREIRGLRNEAVETPARFRPRTLGQASRPAGISTADRTAVAMWVRRMQGVQSLSDSCASLRKVDRLSQLIRTTERTRPLSSTLYPLPHPMRTWAAIIAGIAAFIGLLWLFGLLGQSVGVESYVEYEETRVIEHRLYTEESDGSCTGFGLATTLISGMIALRACHFVRTGSWRGDASAKDDARFSAWLLGGVVYAIVCIAAETLSRQLSPDLARVVDVTGDFPALLLIAWIMHRWYDRRVERITRPDGPSS